MQPHYYIGFQLPEKLRKELERIQLELFDPGIMKEPLEPHITILPPPAVERVEPEELGRQVKLTAAEFWPLTINLTTVDTYKDYAVAISVKSPQIYELQQRLLALLPPEVEAIYYPNPKFSPHVTLAHALHGRSFPPELARHYAQNLKNTLPITFKATHLTLFKWVAPHRYQALPLH